MHTHSLSLAHSQRQPQRQPEKEPARPADVTSFSQSELRQIVLDLIG
ncbi:hypothetical protein [Roseococcus sp. YIM B11640]